MERQKQRFPDFSSFKQHVESVLQNREQKKANRKYLNADHQSAGVLFVLIVPYSLLNGGLGPEQNLLDHIYILFEKRSMRLKNHPGQIAFPGGTKEEQDTNLIETALREAREEVGINPDDPEFISFMDEFISSSRILVKPVLSWLVHEIPQEIFLDTLKDRYYPRTAETDHTLVVPLSHLLHPDNYSSKPYYHEGEHLGWVRYFDVNTYFPQDHVWGLTASMLRRFIDNIFPDHLLPEEPINASTV